MTRFHLTLIAAATLAALATSPRPASAISYPWCAEYSGSEDGGGSNCGFSTIEQCRATISGMGGWCTRNQFYPETGTERQPRRRKPKPHN